MSFLFFQKHNGRYPKALPKRVERGERGMEVLWFLYMIVHLSIL